MVARLRQLRSDLEEMKMRSGEIVSLSAGFADGDRRTFRRRNSVEQSNGCIRSNARIKSGLWLARGHKSRQIYVN